MCSYLNKTGSTYYFRRPVPDNLLGYFTTARGNPRTEWKRSLGTKDRDEAKGRLWPHAVETEKLIQDARRARVETPEQSPEELAASQREREERAAEVALEAASAERGEARSELRTLWRQRRRVSTAELSPEQAAAVDLIRERDVEIAELRAAVAIMKAGNVELGVPQQPDRSGVPGHATGISITDLFERYAKSGAANPKTVRKWRSRVANLVSHLAHDDASRVTRADLNGWTAALVAKGLTKKTVVDGYLPAVRVALAVAHEDGALLANPASGLKVRAPKVVKLRERDLTDDEAQTILAASMLPQSVGLAKQHALARRWVPWLCAYTGARVSEMTQLRAGDIREEAGVWVVHITPEAGSVKTNEARSVPLHSHLIGQGIIGLSKPNDLTPLFYREGAGNEVNPASKIRAADLAKWVRSLGIRAPQPNHGWRHRFKTVAYAVGMDSEAADIAQGHAPRTQAGDYGLRGLPRLKVEIEKLPPYRGEGLPPFVQASEGKGR